MEVSQSRSHREGSNPLSLLPSPTSHSSSSSSCSATATNITAPANPNGPANQNGQLPQGSPRPVTRTEHANPCPTTFVQADTSSFKQVVQMLTGSSKPDQTPPPSPLQQTARVHHHIIPPIKNIPKKSGSGSKLYERRNSLKNLKINPLAPFPGQPGSGASPRSADILSPSILDFPALILSPVTPLTHEPFTRSPKPPCESSNLDTEAEEKAIREKGFFLHPSPATTPREPEPRLLPLFPLSSPRVLGSSSSN